MKQKKYLGRRIFALTLALLLSLNTATAYAAPDVPAVSESADNVSVSSEPSADQEEPKAAEETGDTEKKTETEVENKENGSEDIVTGGTGQNGQNVADTPTGGSEVTDPAARGDGSVVSGADTPSEDELPEEETEVETEQEAEPEVMPEEIPEEVKAFLDAAARIPEEITLENMEEAGELANAAYDAYELLIDAGYDKREDVAEAYARLENAYAEICAVWENEAGGEKPEVYAAGTVQKTSIAHDFQQFGWSNDFSYDGYNYYCQTTKGQATITDEEGVYDLGIPNINPRGGWVQPNADSYYNPTVTGTNGVVDVDVSWSGKQLRIDFKPGTKKGKSTVKVQISFKYTTIGAYGGTTADGNLYFWYDVTNNIGDDTPESTPNVSGKKLYMLCEEDYANYEKTGKLNHFYYVADFNTLKNYGYWTKGEIVKNDGSDGISAQSYPYKYEIDWESSDSKFGGLLDRNCEANGKNTKKHTFLQVSGAYYWNGSSWVWIHSKSVDEELKSYAVAWYTEKTVSKITDFTKELVKTEEEARNLGIYTGITFPGEDGKVEIPEDGAVTLLYKITVTGTPGMGYKVTDDGATHVAGDPLEGTIPASGEAVIYVKKSFIANDVNDNGELVNTATVTPGKGDESPSSSTETTPTKPEEIKKNLDSVKKEVISSEDSVSEEVKGKLKSDDIEISYPDSDGKVKITGVAKVTLLYKITVTGDDGAAYKVTDADAIRVGGDGTQAKKGDPITGAISGTNAVIYVVKSFTADDIDADGNVKNTAKLESGDKGTTNEPNKGEDSVTTPVGKTHTVTVNFWADTDTEHKNLLRDSIEDSYDDGSEYAYPFEDADAITVRMVGDKIPVTIIGKDGKTYSLDVVLTEETELGKLSGTVTEDIVVDLIYSLDEKGKDNKDENAPDGTPDKYQAKIIYKVSPELAGKVTGESRYVTLEKHGKPSTTGEISVSSEAEANENYYFVNWTAEAAGHNGWSYKESTDSTISHTINEAKGGAVYTFTANFAVKEVLEIEIKGNTDTVVYDGSEHSVTGYSMVVKDKEGKEISLPSGLTVTPASDDCEVKGTKVNDDDNSEYPERYPMGLTKDQFSVIGDNTDKYTVTFDVTDGWLKITKSNTLTVAAGDVTTVYDGEEHPVTPVVTVGVTVKTDDAEITIVYVDRDGNESEKAPVDAGIYTAKVTAKLDGYEDATCEATVTIAKRKLTVTTGSASKTYDGTPLTNSTAGVDVEGGAVDGEEITATATGSRTEVGSTVNTYKLNWGNAKESNYEIAGETLGTLTVNAAGGGGGGNDDDDDDDPDPTTTTPPTPPTPTPTPIIPGPVPTVGPVPVVPTVTPVAPTTTAPTPTAALASPTPEAVALADEEVPLAAEGEKQPEEVEMNEEGTPLAGGRGAAWALINFALMNLAIFESLMLLIGYFVNTKNDKEEEEEKRKLKKKGIFRIISLPIAIISLIAFILTEDITLPTAFVDKYTIVMLIIAIIQTIVVALSNKKYEDEEEENA